MVALFVAFSGACATPEGAPERRGLSERERAAKAEPVAFEAERQLNLAEKSLEALDPDAAESQLLAAQRSLTDPKINLYPEADLLRVRHNELGARVPGVREEVARRKLAAEVAEAKEKIEAAKSDLDSAMVEVKRKDPGEATFKRADGAADTLRGAVDDASPLESRDAEYGKYAIGVRKHLAGQRELLEKRKIAVAVDAGKQEIEGSLAVLNAAVGALKARDVGGGDFERAKNATEQVEGALKRGDETADKDIPFAKYVAASRQKLGAARKAIDDRHHLWMVDTQRAKVEGARKAMGDAVGRLSAKDVSPSAFEEAEAMTRRLEGALAEGSELEAKDRGYASYASGIKKQHVAAQNRIAQRRLEVQVSAARAELATRRELLGEALRRLMGPTPSEGDFGAALEAVGAVEKAIDAAAELRAKDRALAQYAVESEKSLIPARATIGRRRLELEIAEQNQKLSVALERLTETTRKINSPGDFDAAEGAVNGVERTLDEGEKYIAKDAKYGKRVIDARKRVSAARQTIRVRRDEVAMQEQKAKVEVKRERLKELVGMLSGFSTSDEQFKAAREALDETHRALDEGDELERRLKAYASYAVAVRKGLADTKKRIEERQLVADVRARRMLLDQALGTAKLRVADVKKAESSADELKSATEALVSAREELVAGVELERRDAAYRKFSTDARKKLGAMQAVVDEVEPAVRFRAGPVTALREARATLSAAQSLQGAEERSAYDTVLDKLRSCQSQASDMLGENKKLGRMSFVAGRKSVKGSEVAKTCAEEAKAVEKKLQVVAARIAFYEGPAKTFTTGQNKLERAEASGNDGARAEALNEAIRAFEECVGEGRILEHKYSAMKKQTYDLDGRQVTVGTVVKACQVGAERARTMLRTPGP